MRTNDDIYFFFHVRKKRRTGSGGAAITEFSSFFSTLFENARAKDSGIFFSFVSWARRVVSIVKRFPFMFLEEEEEFFFLSLFIPVRLFFTLSKKKKDNRCVIPSPYLRRRMCFWY